MQDAEKQTEKMDQSEPLAPEQEQEKTAGGEQATGDAAQDQQQQQLAAAQAKIADMQDAFLRARAEAENIRRRAQEDVSKAHKFAIEAFAELLVPVRDSLEMALTVETPSVASLKEGVEMTLKQLATAFEKNKLTEISPQPGDKLDPARHQPISMVPAEQDANTIVTVLQKGYMISDRLLRPALVTVSQGK